VVGVADKFRTLRSSSFSEHFEQEQASPPAHFF